MSTPKVKLEDKLNQFYSNVLCTIVENRSSQYWSTVEQVTRDAKGEYTSATIREDYEEGDPPNEPVLLDFAKLEEGFKKMQDRNFKINSSMRGTILVARITMDAGDMDIDACDCLIQAALFGKLVYG